MLMLDQVTVRYGDQVALDLQSKIQIADGDIVGIIGRNGAGKSTLIKALTDQVAYTGQIDKPADIAVHLQENHYPDTVTCQTILEGLLQTTYRRDQKLQALVAFFEFAPLLKRKFQQLSGGQQQRLTIMMVLYQDAALTCFDELSTGLDFETRQQLMGKIKAWYAEKSATILMITHYFDELEALANQLLIIEQGKMLAYGPTTALFQEYVGAAAVIVAAPKLDLVLPVGARQIAGESGTTAIGCDSPNTQQAVIALLNQAGVAFTATRLNLTLIYLNVLALQQTVKAG